MGSGDTLPHNEPPPTHHPDLNPTSGFQFRERCRHARIGVTGYCDATGADLWLPGLQLWPLAAAGSAGAQGPPPFRILSQCDMAASALYHRYAGYIHVILVLLALLRTNNPYFDPQALSGDKQLCGMLPVESSQASDPGTTARL